MKVNVQVLHSDVIILVASDAFLLEIQTLLMSRATWTRFKILFHLKFKLPLRVVPFQNNMQDKIKSMKQHSLLITKYHQLSLLRKS